MRLVLSMLCLYLLMGCASYSCMDAPFPLFQPNTGCRV